MRQAPRSPVRYIARIHVPVSAMEIAGQNRANARDCSAPNADAPDVPRRWRMAWSTIVTPSRTAMRGNEGRV
ncbi:MAG: hypothetical protein LC793_05230 [Thermomicrobia bacterium]|nr:hypothetical protein [Thermomicrobia bacterium]